MSKEMSLMEHFAELRARVIRAIITVMAISAGSFAFSLRNSDVGGFTVYYLFPDPFHNIAAQFLQKLQEDLVPEYVRVIVTTPGEAIFSLFYVSIFLGIALGMPMIVYQLGKFVAPGLYPHEKRLILRMAIPSAALFIGGAIFAYFYVIPFTLNFLFRYALSVNLTTFLTITSFVSFVLMFLLAFGLAFQMPIIMVGLTSVGVVESDFWKRNFNYAAVGMLIFGALITPDGSGITMFLVAGPMLVLYAAGYLLTTYHKVKIGIGPLS
ncbi:twin-arginine translocase subunit TatC [Candidatus Hecatella orcuttiae]|jgi:sec-independent protein translocase protein TatC|uniref:twin-arginine translocase subunit TatC n=1 Tax=Candidatus Hecatella orcuttiae TaxID=1935119 RepID=UPI002867E94F|nr:twin-arginine translocase subunit TatC [Candidatus Hecatella orcuttiae]